MPAFHWELLIHFFYEENHYLKKKYLAKFDAASSLHKTELMRGRYQICGAKSGL